MDYNTRSSLIGALGLDEKDDPLAPQYLMHLRVAKKCVEEIIS